MNKIIVIILIAVLFGACSSISKSGSEPGAGKEITREFQVYYNHVANMEYEKAMEYIVPDFFTIFPKDEMIIMMEQLFNTPGMTFQLSDPQVLKIGKVQKVNGRYYTKMQYSNLMNMKITAYQQETAEEKKDRISVLKSAFEINFGSGNVKYNEETDFFEIFTIKEAIAVSKNGKSEWKFLTVEENQKFLLEKIIPEQVLKMEY